MENDNDQQIADLTSKVQSLQQSVAALQDILASHQHLAGDGSLTTEGKPDLKAATISLSGGKVFGSSVGDTALTIYDTDKSIAVLRRGTGMQVEVVGKGTPSEQIEGIWSVGKNIVSLPNADDFDIFNLAEVSILYDPNDTRTPPFANLIGIRTPYLYNPVATGTIVLGGTLLTDPSLKLKPGALAGCRLSLYNTKGIIEAWTIATNSATTITINGAFISPSGLYSYEVYGPMFLGSADNPWRSLYLDNEGGRAIRFGQGPSSGTSVMGVYYGKGAPAIAANVGSVYLRSDGGAGSSFYVKESASGSASGWVAK